MAVEVNIQDIIDEVSAKERFNKLDNDRTTVLERARACSQLTIPSILPVSGHTEQADLTTPYQAVGSRLVNNLASKLLLSMLPPNTPFFRLLVSDDVKALAQQEDPTAYAEVEAQLVQVEQTILKNIEREALRVPTFQAMRNLIVTGNALMYKTEEGIKVYNLNNYVVVRDYKGQPVEIITKETVLKDTLPEDILSKMGDDLTEEQDLGLYTRAVFKNGTWYEYQSVEDIAVDGSEQTYKDMDSNPYIPLRWSSINGENYGRGLVEQYLGDFRSLEGIYQLLLEAAAVQARVLFGLRPGSQADIDELNDADNGSFVFGDLEQDITTLRVDKNSDLQMPMQLAQDITRRLEQAFLVASSVARDSERTTATEIRYMAADLEESLGGVYSVLSLEYQKPLALILLKQSKINLKQLGLDVIIVTGIEALGRNAELDKLRQFNMLIQEINNPQFIAQALKPDAYIKAIGNALQLDTTPFIKTAQEVQQEQQAAQEQQLMMQGAGNLVNSATQPQQ